MTQSIPFDIRMEDIRANVVDVNDFNERVIGAYNSGLAERGLPADDQMARSVVPAATGALRDFSYIAPDIPEFIPDKCVGCMECVTQCPDTAILGKVAEPAVLEEQLAQIEDEGLRQTMAAQWAITTKYFTVLEKKGTGGGRFGIFIDPTKCKGCSMCGCLRRSRRPAHVAEERRKSEVVSAIVPLLPLDARNPVEIHQ